MKKHKLTAIAAISLTFSVLTALLANTKSASANYMDAYFGNGMTIRLVTPKGFNVNLPYPTNGGMINTFEPDGTDDWKFVVVRSSADGFKLKRVGTNHLITTKNFPARNLTPLEAWQDVGGEDKFQTWVATPTRSGFFAICLKAQRDQCMNVPNSKNRTRLTTYKFNFSDQDQMFSAVLIKPTQITSDSVQRGKVWIDKHLGYNQQLTANPDGSRASTTTGYRTDCSGFISMAWGLPAKGLNVPATGSLGSYANTFTAKDQLQPGDAINNRQDGDYGHVVLFVRWIDQSQGRFVAYEENGGYGAVQTSLTLVSTDGWSITEYPNHAPWVFQRKKQ